MAILNLDIAFRPFILHDYLCPLLFSIHITFSTSLSVEISHGFSKNRISTQYLASHVKISNIPRITLDGGD
jgi:hypothetical protein